MHVNAARLIWTCTLVWLACLAYVAAKPVPSREQPGIDPAGIWTANEYWRVEVTPRQGEWAALWYGRDGNLCWTGIMQRDGDSIRETYTLPGRACNPWLWRTDCNKMSGNGWTLTRKVP